MLDGSCDPQDFIAADQNFSEVQLRNDKKAGALSSIKALRGHGDVGVARNLDAAAAVADLKIVLRHGDFGLFCERELQISKTYRARLIKLNKVRYHIADALTWAATQEHGLAECQSAYNLIKLVGDWLKRDEPPTPKTASSKQESQPKKDGASKTEPVTQQDVNLVRGHEKTNSELTAALTEKSDIIDSLQRRLSESNRGVTRRPIWKDAGRESRLYVTAVREKTFEDE